ncbi:hypothetical protein N7532_011832 [Penicillium argentinense]|uniref:Uncharacterized protein n=1 Tax=Penicillium argentinense TaxID=1131581 RepID=A0A9W9EJ73_9EURO|nr:uncharacterized protein N7532_011832 [Penicillium argentinense]KAJ5082789.1 hypothetical protein N7532_011832 [Penicillium argentinense]
MPLTVHTRHTHAKLPISLWTTISLIVALCYLQIVYTVSFLARPFWSSHQDFPPFKQTLERAENFAVDIILDIVTSSQYRSPAPTNLVHDDPIGQRITTALHAPRTVLETPPYVVSGGSGNVIPPYMPQCYPEPRGLQMSPKPKETQMETLRSEHIERYKKINDSGVSVYGTARKVSSSTRPKLSTSMEMHQQYTSQPTEPALGPEPGLGTSVQSSQRTTNTVTKQEEYQEEQTIVHIEEITQPADPAPDISPPITPVMDMPKPPMSPSKSPAVSFDGPTEPAPELEMHSPSSQYSGSHYTDDTGSVPLNISRAAKSHSTESYPGKFPVSEGKDYSSLATAEYAFREKGTTSARPFSDY